MIRRAYDPLHNDVNLMADNLSVSALPPHALIECVFARTQLRGCVLPSWESSPALDKY